MKFLRWVLVVILIFVMGYLSGLGLFADSSTISMVSLVAIYIVGCAAVGALIPEYWALSGLGSWGAVLIAGLELAFSLGRDPVPGQQPTGQVIFILLTAVGLALLSGYFGYRIRIRNT